MANPGFFPGVGGLLPGRRCEVGERGPDWGGVPVYGDPPMPPPGRACVSVLQTEPRAADLGIDATVARYDETYLVTADVESAELLDAVRTAHPDAVIAGFGTDMAVLKGVGHPRVLTESWELAKAQGWQGVGHTRMATESAVTPAGCHPYAVGPEQCLVHNGSFSNHATIRRELRAAGVRFDSENDTEVGARFVAKQLADGADMETALKRLCAVFDGFYTLLVSNRDSFAVVRDAIACKPAVIAETDDWVAVASEYRALADLPGVSAAKIYEPEPEVVYVWTR
nr:MAG: glutamine amidotransferase [Mycolicibacterium hassiacum]